MVDTDEIKRLLDRYYYTSGKPHIDDQGVVHVDGDVSMRSTAMLKRMPVKFGKVTQNFYCDERGLETLENAPTWVGKDFWCQYNELTSLYHAPTHVGGTFNCYSNKLSSLVDGPTYVGGEYKCYGNHLINLDGLPELPFKEFAFTYHKQLPLLRCLTAQSVYISQCPSTVGQIIHKYEGQGRKGALACAAELIKAGLKDNARW